MASKKKAEVQLSVDDRSFKTKLADASKRWGKFGKQLGKGVSSGFGRAIGGGARGAAKLAGIAGFAGVGALVGSEISKTSNFEEALTRLKIASRGAIGSTDEFRRAVFATSSATGLGREQVLAGASAYVTLTGDAKTAAASMELFAKIQRGTGASMDDIAASAAALSQNLKIAPEDFEKAFSILIAGGKAGSVELKDMAGLMAGLAPLAERFAGGSGTSGLASLGAALQIARQGFGSAEEAATGLESLMGALIKNSGKLKKSGVSVYEKDGKTLRNFQTIVEEIKGKGFTSTQLISLLGRKEAESAFIQLSKIDGAWEDLASSTMGAKDVAEDYAAFQASSAGRMQKAYTDLKNRIAEAFTPERIEAFTAAIEYTVKLVGDLVSGLAAVGSYILELLPGGGKSVADAAVDQAAEAGKLEEMAKNAPTGDRAAAIEEAQASGNVVRLAALGATTNEMAGLEARKRLDKDVGKRQRRIAEAVRNTLTETPPSFDFAADSKQPAAGGGVYDVKVGIDRRGNLAAAIENNPSQGVGVP
jgi:TP901 family phage tail tape measure protein